MPRSIPSRSASLLCGLFVVWATTASGVTPVWLEVGDPGNPCDVQSQGCFGAVSEPFWISATEVSNSEYAEFLNAVAADDPNGLYHTSMANAGPGFGGINRSGSPGSYAYSVPAGLGDRPVNHVSFYDALRFANWMHNGQPSGAQASPTTEDGAYTISASGVQQNSIARNAGATVVLTSEDEWYKAAYFDGVAQGYRDFPAGSDFETLCTDSTSAANSANCENAVGAGTGGLTGVANNAGSPSPYGTLAQGGNVWEWNESVPLPDARGLRGGAFNHEAGKLGAETRSLNDPGEEANNIGFRVAMLPEPGRGLLLAVGLLAVWALPRFRGTRCGRERRGCEG